MTFLGPRLRFGVIILAAFSALLAPSAHGQETSSPPEPYLIEAPPRTPSGLYFRAGGMSAHLQDDARLRDGSGTVGIDDGYGISFAAGYRDRTAPVAFELEYTYRDLETDDFIDPFTSLLGDNDISLHTIAVNVLFDRPELIGPVGIYAGVGIGAHISEFSLSTRGGSGPIGSTTTKVHGEGFYWQAMAGITVTLDPAWQLYGGVRWTDAGTIEDDVLRADGEILSFELGVRFYF